MKVLNLFHGQYLSGAEFVALTCLGLDPTREDHALILCDNPALHRMLADRLGAARVLSLDLPLTVGRLDRWLLFGRLARRLARMLPPALATRGWPLDGFDLIYYNNTFEIALAAGLTPPCPEICHVHDMVLTLRAPVRRAFRRAVRRCRRVLTVSQAAAGEITALLGSSAPVTVVYNAAPLPFQPSSTPNLPLRTFAFFGGHHRRKGLDVAVAGLAAAGQNGLSLDIFGAVADRYRRELLRRAGNVRLQFHGSVSREAVTQAMLAADAILVPSRRDPLPTVVLEALALGHLVLAAAVDGVPEMIEDSRFLFAPNDPSSLAGCIARLNALSKEDLALALNSVWHAAKHRFQTSGKCETVSRIISEAVRGPTP